VSPPTVQEDGPANLVYVFTRDLPGAPLTVNFTATGTANYFDYTVSSPQPLTFAGPGFGTLTFPAGALTAQLVVDPINDNLVETNETVGVTVVPGAG